MLDLPTEGTTTLQGVVRVRRVGLHGKTIIGCVMGLTCEVHDSWHEHAAPGEPLYGHALDVGHLEGLLGRAVEGAAREECGVGQVRGVVVPVHAGRIDGVTAGEESGHDCRRRGWVHVQKSWPGDDAAGWGVLTVQEGIPRRRSDSVDCTGWISSSRWSPVV